MTAMREALGAATSTPARKWINEKSLPIVLDHLLAFIKHYQDTHSGVTPTMNTCANELGVTDAQIRYYLGKLEQDGRIHRFGQNPIRVMVKDSPMSLESARRATAAILGKPDLPGTAQERFEAVDERRRQLGKFIAQYWSKKGRPPTYKEMMVEIDAPNFNWLDAQIQILRDRGFVKPGCLRLTDNGAIVYGLKKGEASVATQAPKPPRPTSYNTGSMAEAIAASDKKAEAVYAYIVEFNNKYGRTPLLKEIAGHFKMGAGHPANVAHLIKKLKKSGKISSAKGRNSIVISGTAGRHPRYERGEQILAYIKAFTQKHGRQPSMDQIAKGLGIGGGRAGDISHPFKIMERMGMISRTPGQHGVTILGEEDRPMNVERKITIVDKRLSIPLAKRVAEFLDDYHRRFNATAAGREIAEGLGYGGNSLSVTLNKMTERGWIHHQFAKKGDYSLTDLGRITLLDRHEEPDPDDAPPLGEEFFANARRGRQVETGHMPLGDPAPGPPAPFFPAETVESYAERAGDGLYRESVTTAVPQPQTIPAISPEAGPILHSERYPQPSRPPISVYPDGDLVVELINRGYNVSKR